MPTYRGTMFFTYDVFGWTESHYLIGSTTSAAITNLLNIITPRLALLHVDALLVNATVSDIAVRGDSIPAVTEASLGTFADALGPAPLDTALLIKWQVGVFTRYMTYLRALGAGEFNGGYYDPSITTPAKITTYETAIIANAQCRVLNPVHSTPPVVGDYTLQPITAGFTRARQARRKTGRPFGLPRGRQLAG